MCGDAAVDWRMRGHAGQSWVDERKYFILEDELRQEEGRDDEVRTGGKVRISPRSAELPTSQTRRVLFCCCPREDAHWGDADSSARGYRETGQEVLLTGC